jgi:hypothetical protein
VASFAYAQFVLSLNAALFMILAVVRWRADHQKTLAARGVALNGLFAFGLLAALLLLGR